MPHGAPPVHRASAPTPVRGSGRGAAAAHRPRSPTAPTDTVSALDVRADLGREGPRDGDRGAAGDRGAPSRGALRDRRAHASGHRAPRRRALPADARAGGARPRPRGSRRVRRSLPQHRRDRRPARRDRRLRDPVPGARADLVGSAHVRHRRRLRRRLDAVLVCAGHARHRAPARSCRSPIQPRWPMPSAATSSSRSSSRAARAEARRIGAQLGWPSVAEATAAVLARGGRARAAPPPIGGRASISGSSSLRTDHLLTLVDDVGIVQHANGVIPNRETGYCVDDVARLAVVALELARRGDEQVWTSILYRSLAFLQDATDAAGGHAELHGLRPPLARRAAPRRPRRSLGLGARRDPLDGLGARCRRPDRAAPRRDRPSRSRRTHRCARAPTPLSASPTSTPTGAVPKPGGCSSASWSSSSAAYAANAGEDWLWFEDALTYDNARLPHALIVGGVTLGRDRPDRDGLDALRWLGDESGLADGTPPADRARRPPSRRARAGYRGRAAARRIGVRRGRAGRVRRHRQTRSTGRAPSGRSTGSSAATGFTGRSTTSRPAAAATGSARRRRTTTRGPSRRSPSTARRSCSTLRGCRPSLRHRARELTPA